MSKIIDDLFDWIDKEEYLTGDELKGAIKLTISNNFKEKSQPESWEIERLEYKESIDRFAKYNHELQIEISALQDQLEYCTTKATVDSLDTIGEKGIDMLTGVLPNG